MEGAFQEENRVVNQTLLREGHCSGDGVATSPEEGLSPNPQATPPCCSLQDKARTPPAGLFPPRVQRGPFEGSGPLKRTPRSRDRESRGGRPGARLARAGY